MTIIIVDDERLVIEGEERIVRNAFPDDTVESFLDCRDALEYVRTHVVDVVLADIHMNEMTGLEFAVECKKIYSRVNIIFVTAYSEYALEAYRLHASGYLLKPLQEDEIKNEIEHLRIPVKPERTNKLEIRTFGNFDVRKDGEGIQFESDRSKEILAYLIDRKGAFVSTKEIAAALWEDKEYNKSLSSQLSKYVALLLSDLKCVGAGKVVEKTRSKLRINTDEVYCDYYRLLQGDMEALNLFQNEYMANYSWAEFTLGEIVKIVSHRIKWL